MTKPTSETRFSYSATGAGYAIYDAEGPRHSLPPALVCDMLARGSADRAALAEARAALVQHRNDLHQYSRRPCATCRKSAAALGIVGKVPDSCANFDADRAALAASGEEG